MAGPPKPIAVLDTNLYVSYLITPSGPTARLVELGLAGEAFSIATSGGLVEELRRVVTYPHIISKYTIDPNRMLKNSFSARLLKKVQMQGGARCEVRGVLGLYVAAPHECANAADGPFSAAC